MFQRNRTILARFRAIGTAAVLLTAAAGGGAAVRPPVPVTIAIPAPSEPFTAVYVARDLHLFERHGLSARIITMKMPTALAALFKGSITFEAGAGSGIRATETGFPFRTVLITLGSAPFLLMGARGITKISQIRGKTVALKAPTEAITEIGEVLLERHGLPSGSYKYVNAGDTPAEIGMLTQGLAAATVLELTPSFTLKAKGYPVLASAFSIRIPLSGLVVNKAAIQSSPDVIQRAVAAMLDAINLCRTDKARVVPVMEKEFHVTNEIAGKVYDLLRSAWLENGRPSSASIQFGFAMDLKTLELAHAKIALKTPFKMSDVYDFRFLPKH